MSTRLELATSATLPLPDLTSLTQQGYWVSVTPQDRLSLQRFYADATGPPVLLLHGAIENGAIFYSSSGKGLAPFLAAHGFDVYVADLRGHGRSQPPISRASEYGQTEMITEDIPALVQAVEQLRPASPQHWIAHSWGGVLLSACLARYPQMSHQVASQVYFGTKRSVRVWNLQRLMMIDIVWHGLANFLTAVWGYLPARQWRLGSDNETAKYHAQSKGWVRADAWIDPEDGFDYIAALRNVDLPPTWYLAARNDFSLGHPLDVQRFMREVGQAQSHYTELARANGYRHDYDHISMLTHADAPRDHFPQILTWLQTHNP